MDVCRRLYLWYLITTEGSDYNYCSGDPHMMHTGPADIFPLGFINFKTLLHEHKESNRYFMIAIITNVCLYTSNFT